jgi:hypothetical protein
MAKNLISADDLNGGHSQQSMQAPLAAGSPVYSGQLMNPNGTPATPDEVSSGQWAANVSQSAREAGAADGGVLPALKAAGQTIAGVGLMGGVVLGGELAAPAAGLGLGGALGGGALAGAAGAAASDEVGGHPLTLGSVGKGAGLGALTAGVGYGLGPNGLNATGALSNATGISPTASSAVVQGAAHAGEGAIGSAVNGGNPLEGAVVGGASGAASGAAGTYTGTPGIGTLAGLGTGIIAGDLASKYLSPSTPSSTTLPATATGALPSLPGSAPATSTTQQVQPTSQAPVAGSIGTYSGYNGPTTGLGYAPRQEANMSGTDWATYGQGPEQQFFQPAGT